MRSVVPPTPCRELGCGRGSAIGVFMPMTPEIVVALLAIAKVGGIFVPLFSGYGEGRGGLAPDRCGRGGSVHGGTASPPQTGTSR